MDNIITHSLTHTEQTIKHTRSCLLVFVAGWTSCPDLSFSKLKDTGPHENGLFPLYTVFRRAHCRVPWFSVSSLQCPWGFNRFLPKSNTDLFICLHYLLYFLFGPIGNGWSAAWKDNRETNHWEKIRVELPARQISFFASCLLTCLTDLGGCDCNAMSGEGSQREDYKWQAASHYHSQFRGTQESQLVQRHNHNTQVGIFAAECVGRQAVTLSCVCVVSRFIDVFFVFSLSTNMVSQPDMSCLTYKTQVLMPFVM